MEQQPDASRLSRILELTAAELRVRFDKVRDAIKHNGLVGQEGEKIVATFLRERLPSSIGVTTGEVLDVEGGRSRQTDVVLFDAMRTPMLFTGEGKDTHVVPAEGVLAVIEVKTRLRSSDLEGCLANCRSVKQRVQTAYFPQPIQIRHVAYGQEWDDLPIFFYVFGAASDNLYAKALNDLQADVPVHERIDMLCCLDRDVTANAGIDITGGTEALKTVISARSLPKGGLADIETPMPLLVWYAMLASTVMQTGTRPIGITRYVAEDLHVQAQMPGGAIGRAMYDEALVALVALADHQGIDAEILRRWQAKEPLSARDQYEMLRAPGYAPAPDLPEPQRQLLDLAIEAAKTLPFEQWESLALVSPTPETNEDSTDCP